MLKMKHLLILPVVAFGLSGCWLDDDDDDAPTPEMPETTYSNVRVVHASSDAPTVDILVNGEVFAGLEDVDYQIASPWIEVETGEYDVAVEANLPGDDANVIEATLMFEEGKTYDILAVGSVADETLGPLVIENDAMEIGAGNARVQVAHAAAGAPEVDIYVTAPDADITTEQPVATAAFMDVTGQLEVPAGDYQIRITPMGSTDVVFDSGTVTLAEAADLLIMATDNVATGESPVTLLVSDGEAMFSVYDVDTPADVRVVHGVADAPAVDVIANNELTVVDALAFPDATDYLSLEPDTYLLDVAADADNSLVVIDDAEVEVAQGMRYTAIANNDLENIGLGLLVDNPRSVATAAKVRIVHASPSAGSVDIYVTADGNIADVDPAFSEVGFDAEMLQETGYVELAAGDYVVTVTPTGTKDVALETGVLSLAAGEVYTAIAVDAEGGGLPVQVIGLDGLAAD